MLQILTRVWTSLGSVATRLADLFGAKHILGLESRTAFTGLVLILMCLLCGWLVKFTLVTASHDLIERQLARYIPGYEAYKATAEAKLHKGTVKR